MLANVATLSVVVLATIYGDYLIKLASMSKDGVYTSQFVVGAAIYGLSAIGWLYLMRDHSLMEIGVLYSCFMLLMLAALGYFIFNEQLKTRQIIGGALAIASIVVTG